MECSRLPSYVSRGALSDDISSVFFLLYRALCIFACCNSQMVVFAVTSTMMVSSVCGSISLLLQSEGRAGTKNTDSSSAAATTAPTDTSHMVST